LREPTSKGKEGRERKGPKGRERKGGKEREERGKGRWVDIAWPDL